MKKNKKRDRDDKSFYQIEQVASNTECTGLMPALPETEEEDVNYAELYSTHCAKLREK